MTLADHLAAAIEAKQTARVRDLVTAATEKERRAAGATLTSELPGLLRTEDHLSRRATAAIALLGTMEARQLSRSGWMAGNRDVDLDLALAVVRARPVPFRRAVVRAAGNVGFVGWLWPVAFELVKSGDAEVPDTDAWFLHALSYMFRPNSRWTPLTEPGEVDAWMVQVRERWRNDPALVEQYLLALDIEQAALELSGSSSRLVQRAMVQAVGDGTFERSRLLDLCLDGFFKDFRPTATRFFGRLWDELGPTTNEKTERVDSLLRVAGSSDAGGRLLALEALIDVVDSGADSRWDDLAAAAGASVGQGTKKLALTAFKLLERLVADTPDAAMSAAAAGLGHSRSDVQESAVSFIERHIGSAGDGAAIRAEVLGWVDAVEPQLTERVEALVGVTAPATPLDGPDVEDLRRRCNDLPSVLRSACGLDAVAFSDPRPLRPVDFDAWTAPILTEDLVLTPINDPEELIEAMVAFMAAPGDGIDFERLLDGLARLGVAHREQTGISAIRAQISRLEKEFGSLAASTPAVQLARAWLDGTAPGPLPFLRRKKSWRTRKMDLSGELIVGRETNDRSALGIGMVAFDGLRYPAHPAAMADVRAWEVAHQLAEGESRQPLAIPTHGGGWIDPVILYDRLASLHADRRTPARFDAVQALLRLYPVASSSTVDALQSIGNDVARAASVVLGASASISDEALLRATRLRVELGEPVASYRPPRKQGYSGTSALRWPGAAAPAVRRRDDPVGVLLGNLATPPERISWWNSVNALLAGADTSEMSRAVLAFPRFPDLYGAAVATTVVFEIDANRSSDADHLALARYLDPDVPLGAGATAGLAVALASGNMSLATVAVDVIIGAIGDGRLDDQRLGGVLAENLNTGIAGLSRPAARLRSVAETSLLHADGVRRICSATLARLADRPRDLHAFLECLVAAGTSCGRGVGDTSALRYLEAAATGTSKRAKLAREVLQLPAEWTDRTPELIAIDGRLARAERWQQHWDDAARRSREK